MFQIEVSSKSIRSSNLRDTGSNNDFASESVDWLLSPEYLSCQARRVYHADEVDIDHPSIGLHPLNLLRRCPGKERSLGDTSIREDIVNALCLFQALLEKGDLALPIGDVDLVKECRAVPRSDELHPI